MLPTMIQRQDLTCWTLGVVRAAQFAMEAFDRTAPEEKADVLALMLANVRG